MVNFRFHLVSLVAVFLALGVGIIVGSTVIDQVTVQGLERNVKTLKDQRDSARDDRASADRSLSHWTDFDRELPSEVLAGRLTSVPVLVVAVEGVEPSVTERVHEWLATAKADDLGTLTLTAKLSLDDADDRRTMASILDTAAGRRETVQRAALDAIAAALNPPVGTPTSIPALLPRLRDAGFVTFDAPEGIDVDLASVPKTGTRLALMSASDPALPNTDVGVPLTGLLARQPGVSMVAADATPVGNGDAAFAAAIRADAELRRRVSTVDDVSEGYGQMALVLAIEDLAGGVVGHYGVAADRLLPPPNR